MATTTAKPKLELTTPMTTSTFPSELSALSATSARSPLPGFADFIIKTEEGTKTPITPPLAYTAFLKTMGSPISGDRPTPTSMPSSSSSEHSSCSCACETHKSPTSTSTPITPFNYTASAPSSARLGRLRIPGSPAYSHDSPSSARSPFSTRSALSAHSAHSARTPHSALSPFDWDFKNKGRYYDIKPSKSSRCSVRSIKETVTRTVTYTPHMSPAPKGKRRKVE